MDVRAVVWEGVGKPMQTTDLTLAAPGPKEVLVRLGASGVCHTDLSIIEGKFPVPSPIVLGHEGAGTVEAIGREVTRCVVGDRVVLSLIPQCGAVWCDGQEYVEVDPWTVEVVNHQRVEGSRVYRVNNANVVQRTGEPWPLQDVDVVQLQLRGTNLRMV